METNPCYDADGNVIPDCECNKVVFMEQFTIYCTPEQTIKALELCAGIDVEYDNKMVDVLESEGVLDHFKNKNRLALIDGKMYKCPTAEQMIGWFDAQRIVVLVEDTNCATWYFKLEADGYVNKYDDYDTRKDATLAAIDAALEYLTNNK